MQFEVYGQFAVNGIEEGKMINLDFENNTITDVKVVSLMHDKAVFEVTGESERQVKDFMFGEV